MTDTSAERQIVSQTFTAPVDLPTARIEPSHGLYQPSFNLSEADFLRLKQSSPALSAAGGAVISFALSYALPIAIGYFLSPTNKPSVPSAPQIWTASITFAIGGLMLVAGLGLSRDKRRLMKRIESHFRDNPAQVEYRSQR